jgi:CheY-like chemotaxis protein
MNGSISLKSEVGKGSIFTIVIPNIEISDERFSFSDEKIYTPGSVIFEPANILICDDNESNRKLIIDLLSDSPLNIFEAENGKEAIEKAMTYLPDLILMDLKMPEIDGLEATKILKSKELTGNIPVIALSASARLLKIDIKAEKLFDESLMKPINISELINKLKIFLKYTEKDLNKNQENPVSIDLEIINDKEVISMLPELINIINIEILPYHKKVVDEQMIDKTVDFGKRIIKIGEDFKVRFLINYGKNIVSYADNFEIDKLKAEMDCFPDIVKKLNSFNR